jgi:very-short-patch-repair endonuclease
MTTLLIPPVDARIAASATPGFPVVTRARLRAAGVHRARVADRIARGQLLLLWGQTFLIGFHDPADISRDTLCRAAVASVEPNAMLSGVTAIERHTGWTRFDRVIHVTSDRWHVDVPRRGISFRRTTTPIDRDSIVTVRGIPTAPPIESMLQAARDLTPHQAANAMKELGYHEHTRVDDIECALDDAIRVVGAPALRRGIQLVRSGSAGTRCLSEDRLLPHVTRCFGEPLVNVRGATGITDYEPDLCWPQARCIVEVDGHHHHDDPAVRRADAQRDSLLRELGWIVARVSSYRVWFDLPAVLDEIATAFAGRPGFDVR